MTNVAVKSIKGFDADLKCRGFQFAIGETYRVEGPIVACENGFHAIPDDQHPLSVFAYYPPAGSRFCVVEQSGDVERCGDKLASASLKVDFEISLGHLAQHAAQWVFARADWKNGRIATGPNEGATASGDQGAATASGYQGAATASGDQGAATASGDRGAATASGAHGAATASGVHGKARGALGNALFLVERASHYHDYKIVAVWAGIVGQDGIKPDTFYTLRDGKPVEVA